MKKILGITTILLMFGCKTSSHKCDAYGSIDKDVEFDISKQHAISQEKYTSAIIVKR